MVVDTYFVAVGEPFNKCDLLYDLELNACDRITEMRIVAFLQSYNT
jgi:hypothetical protein